MKATVFIAYIFLLMYFVVGVAFIYLFVLLVRALRKYIKSEPVRKEKAESAKSLGEVIKRYRTQRKMTQEFVAESLGVSRQAVSKWESGASDPSTTNLMALAKLFGVTAEEILKEVNINILFFRFHLHIQSNYYWIQLLYGKESKLISYYVLQHFPLLVLTLLVKSFLRYLYMS